MPGSTIFSAHIVFYVASTGTAQVPMGWHRSDGSAAEYLDLIRIRGNSPTFSIAVGDFPTLGGTGFLNGPAASTGHWYHAVVIWRPANGAVGATLHIRRDDESVYTTYNSAARALAASWTTTPSYIEANYLPSSGFGAFDGKLAAFALYDGELSSDAIAQLLTRTPPGAPDMLGGWWTATNFEPSGYTNFMAPGAREFATAAGSPTWAADTSGLTHPTPPRFGQRRQAAREPVIPAAPRSLWRPATTSAPAPATGTPALWVRRPRVEIAEPVESPRQGRRMPSGAPGTTATSSPARLRRRVAIPEDDRELVEQAREALRKPWLPRSSSVAAMITLLIANNMVID